MRKLALIYFISTIFIQSGICKMQMVDEENLDSYEHIIVSGLPKERGLIYGQQAKDKIHSVLSYYKKSSSMPPWNEASDFSNENYLPAIARYFPSGLEEMKGIAEGAEVSLIDIVILNARYDFSRMVRAKNSKKYPKKKKHTNVGDECTGAVSLKSATLNNHVLIGQNWDISEFIYKNNTAILLEVHPHPSENKKPFITLTEAGQLGRSGMSMSGLGIVAMSLWSSDEFYIRNNLTYPHGWMPATLLRRMFLEAPNLSIGLKAILQTPRHVPSNLIIATAENEALNIELSATKYFITHVPIEKEFLTHSNHFKAASFIGRDEISEGSNGGSSLFRDRRVERVLFEDWPNITEKTFQFAFKDHVGYPNSVCEHSVSKELEFTSTHPTEMTVASIIYNLSNKTMLLAKGPPCENPYKTFTFTQLSKI